MNTSPYNFELDFTLIDRPVDELRRKLSFCSPRSKGHSPLTGSSASTYPS